MEVSTKRRWASIRSAMRSKHSPSKYKKGLNPKMFLDELYEERTKTVHEGSLYVSKKFHGKLRQINRTFVDETLKKLQRIVNAIEIITG